jgi:Tol biopolymer transport system component
MSEPKASQVARRLVFGLGAALLVTAVTAVGLAAWAARGGSAAGSTPTGTVAFVVRGGSHVKAYSDLYVVDADGSNGRVLARCPVGSGNARWLKFPWGCELRSYSWSPDGKRLALLRGRKGGTTQTSDLALYVVDAKGGGERRLPGCGGPRWPSCGDLFGSKPSWAPDGSRLVVQRRGRLLVVDLSRGVYRRLTRGCRPKVCFDVQPAWSPDGSSIAFARTEGPRSRSLYSVKPDGSGLKKLTNLPGWTMAPTWSPNGSRIAFTNVDEAGMGIYTMAADGSDETLLASGPRFSGPSAPAWSPDGRQIVYLDPDTLQTPRPYQVGGPGFVLEVRVIEVDGSGGRRVYRSRNGFAHYTSPAWSPEGKFISFGVAIDDVAANDIDRDSTGLFVMKSDGTGLRKLAEFPVDVAWKPRP